LLFTVLQFESGFNNLSERYSVARTAGALISDWASKIIAIKVREIVCFWKFIIRDVVCIGMVFTPGLRLLKCSLELLGILSKLLLSFLGFLFSLLIELHKLSLLAALAMGAIVLVVSLELANVGLPSEVVAVDEGDGRISNIRWYMGSYWVKSLELSHILSTERSHLLPLSLLAG
jgi:hypothetical protein